MTVYEIIISQTVSFSSPLMTYPIILCQGMSFVLLSSLQLSLLFFLPLFSVGLSLPTERFSCVLVLLSRWKIGLKNTEWS